MPVRLHTLLLLYQFFARLSIFFSNPQKFYSSFFTNRINVHKNSLSHLYNQNRMCYTVIAEGISASFCTIPEKGRNEIMKITVVGRQMNVYEEMKLLIDKKLAKLDKFFAGEGDATVTLSCKHNQKYIELTISAAGALFRSEVGANSFRDALDDAVTNIERQIRKNKTRLARRLREGAFIPPAPEEFDDTPDDDETIIRTKTFSTKPMSPEEAVLQMNLLGHQFFVFVDDQSGATCVVYARHDGGYGLMIPEGK